MRVSLLTYSNRHNINRTSTCYWGFATQRVSSSPQETLIRCHRFSSGKELYGGGKGWMALEGLGAGGRGHLEDPTCLTNTVIGSAEPGTANESSVPCRNQLSMATHTQVRRLLGCPGSTGKM